ncbi:hypothetical protein H4217_005779, partial [Coemansia sp. RSA 1939]
MSAHTPRRQQQQRQQQYAGTESPAATSDGNGKRIASWLRNNWTESETREVMEILVDEFIVTNYTTAAYSKNHNIPDIRFQNLSFKRPSRELYNKVQNLRQRFFTPHSYLLRWASPAIDMRNLRRAEKCLMNPKTRESIHGIFADEVPEAMQMLAAMAAKQSAQRKERTAKGAAEDECTDDSDCHVPGSSRSSTHRRARSSSNNNSKRSSVGNGDEGNAGADQLPLVKSVNYYCDIFHRKAPALWKTSIEAYRLFLANKELQQAGGSEQSDDGGMESRIHRQTLQTPNSSLLTDFQSDIASDATDDYATSTSSRSISALDFGDHRRQARQLIAAVGHSWHKFLTQRIRWSSLKLGYAGKDDWVRQETTFLAQHLLSVVEPGILNVDNSGNGNNSNATIPVAVVPQFKGPFDAAGIKMAVSRMHVARTVRVSALAGDLAACIRDVIEHREPYTMVTLCVLAEPTAAGPPLVSLALLISHGSNDQPFGSFPHHDPILSHLVSASEGPLWHEYTDRKLPVDLPGPLTPLSYPAANAADPPTSGLAFAYTQGGLRYSFFSRRRGSFFEITCADWTPTIVGSGLRAAWQPSMAAGAETVLGLMGADEQKVLSSMAELFGLRPFAHGFFDSVLVAPSSSSLSPAAAAAARAPANSRRVSDDPRLHGPVRRRHGLNSVSSGGGTLPGRKSAAAAAAAAAASRRSRISCGSSPYAAPPLLSPDAALSSSSFVGQSVAATTQFLSPQIPTVNSAHSLDLSSMSLPNSPFAGIPMDVVPPVLAGGGGGYQPSPVDSTSGSSLFPPLNDATLFSPVDQHQAAMAAASVAAAVAMAGASPSITGSALMGTIACSTPSMASVSMEPMASASALAAAGGAFFDETLALQTNSYPAVFGGGVDSNTTTTTINNNSNFINNNGGGNTSSSALSAIHDLHHSPYFNPPIDHQQHQQQMVTAATSPAFWDMAGIALPVTNYSPGQSMFAMSVSESSNASAAAAATAAAEMAMDIVNRVTINGTQPNTAASAEQRITPSVAVYPPQPQLQPSPWDDAATQQPLRSVFGSTEMLMHLAQPSPLQTNYNVSTGPTHAAAIADYTYSGIQPTVPTPASQVMSTPSLPTTADIATAATAAGALGAMGPSAATGSVSAIAAYFGTPTLGSSTYMDDPNSLLATTTTVGSSSASYQFDVEVPTT